MPVEQERITGQGIKQACGVMSGAEELVRSKFSVFLFFLLVFSFWSFNRWRGGLKSQQVFYFRFRGARGMMGISVCGE